MGASGAPPGHGEGTTVPSFNTTVQSVPPFSAIASSVPASASTASSVPASASTASSVSSVPTFGTTSPSVPTFDNTPPSVPNFGNTSPSVPTFGNTSPSVPTFGTTSPSVPTFGTTSPSVPTFGTTSPSVPTFGTTSPSVPTFGTTSPSVPTFGNTSPSVPTFGTTSPSVPTFGTTSPSVPTFGNTSPSVPTFGTTSPSVPTFGNTSPSVPTFGTTSPSVPTFGTTAPSLYIFGNTVPSWPIFGTTEPSVPNLGTTTPTIVTTASVRDATATVAVPGPSGASGASRPPGPPLRFHSVHSPNIWVPRGGAVAMRLSVDDHKNTAAFSATPVRVGDLVRLRVVETLGPDLKNPSIRLGFSTIDPSALPQPVPVILVEFISNIIFHSFKKNDIISLELTPAGIPVCINGKLKWNFESKLPKDLSNPFWVLVDLWNNRLVLQFVNENTTEESEDEKEIENLTSEIRQLYKQDELPLPRYMDPRVPLRLHWTRGLNVQFDCSVFPVATRMDATLSQAYVFTAVPMSPGQTIVIQILLTEPLCTEGLAYGLTSCDPATLRPCDLPDDAEQLLDRPEYWVVRRTAASSLSRGTELSVTLTLDDEMRASIDNFDPTAVSVNQKVKLWLFVDICGAARKVRLLTTRMARSPEQLSVPAGSEEPVTPAKAEPSVGQPDNLQQGLTVDNRASSGTSTGSELSAGLTFATTASSRTTCGTQASLASTSGTTTSTIATTASVCDTTTAVAVPGPAGASGASRPPGPPLRFHSVRSPNIWVPRGGAVAMRLSIDDCKNTVAFSATPVRVGELVCLRVVEAFRLVSFKPSFRLGFSTVDPSALPQPVPTFSADEISGIIFHSFKKNDIISLELTPAGIPVCVNGQLKWSFKSYILTDLSKPFWVLVDLWDNRVAVQFVNANTTEESEDEKEIEKLMSEIRQLYKQDKLPLPRYMDPRVPLRLHWTRGLNVQFDCSVFPVATRMDATLSQAYVFTAVPMPPGQTIVIQILLTEPLCTEGLAYGLTSCDPATLRPCDLPDDAEQLLDRPEYWVVRRTAASSLSRGTELAVTLTLDDEMRASIDNFDPTAVSVNQKVKLWLFVDICGAARKVRLLTTRMARSPEQLSVPAGSEEPVTPARAEPSVGQPDNLQQGLTVDNRASSGTSTGSELSAGLTFATTASSRTTCGTQASLASTSGTTTSTIATTASVCNTTMTVAVPGPSGASGASRPPGPPLRFHSVHSPNIWVPRGGAVAMRLSIDDFNNTVAFSATPVRVGELVRLRVVEALHSDSHSGSNIKPSFRVGFSTVDPSALPHPVPTFSAGFIYEIMMHSFKKNDIISLELTPAGIPVCINGKLKWNFEYFIVPDLSKPFWVLVDLWNNRVAVQFVNTNTTEESEDEKEIGKMMSEIRQLYNTDDLPLPRYLNTLGLLRLHWTRGRNVQFSSTSFPVATRMDAAYSQAYVFTAVPMSPGQTIVIQILLTEPLCTEGLAYGLTSCDPATLRPCDLPDAAEQLLDRPEYWVVRRPAANSLCIGTELEVTLTLDGEMQESINNLNPVTVMHVDHTVELWAFVDIFGATRKVRLLTTRMARSPEQLSVPAGSEEPVTPARAEPSVGQPDNLQPGLTVDNRASKGTSTGSDLSAGLTFTTTASLASTSGTTTSTIATTASVCNTTMTVAVPGPSGASGASRPPGPPLRFHSVRSPDVWVPRDGAVAMRVWPPYSLGAAFSSRPIRIGELVRLRVVDATSSQVRYGIRLGVSTVDPSALPQPFPDFSPDIISDVIFHTFKKNDIISLEVTPDGILVCINGNFEERIRGRAPLPDSSNLFWVLVDPYMGCHAVQFVNANTTEDDEKIGKSVSEIREYLNGDELPLSWDLNSLSLHWTKGRNVQFSSRSCRVAARMEAELSQAYVFTATPMSPGQTIVIEILLTEPLFTEGLAFGLTSCDPATLRPCDLPDTVEELSDRPEYWVVRRHAASSLSRGTELVVTLTLDGEVRESINNLDPITVMHVDPTVVLWAFVDIGGAVRKVRLLTTPTPTPEQLSVPTESEEPETPEMAEPSDGQPGNPQPEPEEQQSPDAECLICCDGVVDSVVYKCGHSCMCHSCALELWRDRGGNCPICRERIQDVIRIYKS